MGPRQGARAVRSISARSSWIWIALLGGLVCSNFCQWAADFGACEEILRSSSSDHSRSWGAQRGSGFASTTLSLFS